MNTIPHNGNGETNYKYFCLASFLNPWMAKLLDFKDIKTQWNILHIFAQRRIAWTNILLYHA